MTTDQYMKLQKLIKWDFFLESCPMRSFKRRVRNNPDGQVISYVL